MRPPPATGSGRPTVLALRALGLGDLMTAVPALRGLRRSLPEHLVVLATSPALEPLVKRLDFVDAMVRADPLAPLGIQLDPDDVAVNLHGRGPESTDRLLETSPGRLIAFSHPDIPATFGSPRWKRREHEIARWCRLLEAHEVDARPDDLHLPSPAESAAWHQGATVIHPGAGARARHWPPDRWAVVVRELDRAGHSVLLSGSAAERPLAMVIAREAGVAVETVVAGDTEVDALADLVATARMLISTDTGPAHVATAFGTPSVVMFGPTSPDDWGPPPSPLHRVVWKGKVGEANAAFPHQGLLEITVDEVLDEVASLPVRDAQAVSTATARSETSWS